MRSRFISFLGLALAVFLAGQAKAYYPAWVRTSFIALDRVTGIDSGDFNLDGRPDVIARTEYGKVHLSLTSPDRTMGSPALIFEGSGVSDIGVADVDGDGKADVVLCGSSELRVLLSNGDGTFDAAISSFMGVSALRFALADFTADGNIDVAVAGYYSNEVGIYAGDGAGSFTPLLESGLPSSPVSVEAADIDGDGKADYVLGYSDGTPFEVHFGNGNGTFAPAVFLEAPPTAGSSRMALVDLDTDGDRDIVYSHFNARTITVFVNNGARTFASPVIHSAPPTPGARGNPVELIAADVNDDGHPDVVTVLANARLLATFTGNGDGSLNAGVYRPTPAPVGEPLSALYLASADFSGDGRIDLAMAGSAYVSLWQNVSGDATATLEADHPTISVGQTATFIVTVDDKQGFDFRDPDAPVPVGTVRLKQGDVEVGSATLTDRVATIEVASLPAGTHVFTAHYDGSDLYRPAVSASTEQRVIGETTAVTLTSSAAGTEVPYGEHFSVSATVTSSIPETLDGTLTLFVDGVALSYTQRGPSGSWSVGSLAAGTHTLHATYDGTATHPPSTSPPVAQVVKKGRTTTVLTHVQTARYSSQPNMNISVYTGPGGYVPGTARLYEGRTLLATGTIVGYSVNVPVSLPVGTHYLHAVFEGSANHEPSISEVTRYVVQPDQGFVIDVSAEGSSILIRTIYDRPAGGYFNVYRRTPSSGWTVTQTTTLWDVSNVPPGTPYTFYVEAYNASNQLVATSNADVAMTYNFIDDRLPLGTLIKSQHLTELEAATNTLRSAAGLGSINIETPPAGTMRASHILVLRTAINEARIALGAAAIPFSGDVAAGLPVKATHILELRDAIR